MGMRHRRNDLLVLHIQPFASAAAAPFASMRKYAQQPMATFGISLVASAHAVRVSYVALVGARPMAA